MLFTRELGSPRHYRLRGRVLQGERSFPLAPGEHRIGSADANEVLLPVTGVSRRHALLTHHFEPSGEARFWLRDLDSRNGTFAGGERLTTREIAAGERLRFGPVELVLEEVDPGDAELALVLRPPAAVAAPAAAGPTIDETTVHLSSTGRAEPAAAAAELVFPPGCVVGGATAMEHLYRSIAALTGADLPLLIEGETGVGKESVAHTLHLSSPRRDGPFVAVNCAAIPGELLEAEMFGIGEGVATGVKKRSGKFRAAQGGTLFLDEIAELPLELQAKLLRALQEKEIQPLGGAAEPVDVRVLAATNLDLARRVAERSFRRDLYYRVAGSVLRVPPLRERSEDIPRFIEHFLRRAAEAAGKAICGVTVKALRLLVEHPWPGNVRELEHEVQRLAHLCPDGQAIDSSLVSAHIRDGTPPVELVPPVGLAELPVGASPAADAQARDPQVVGAPTSAELAGGEELTALRLADHVQATERRVILAALERTGGSVRGAARLLEISRTTLLRKIDRLDIPT